jgi:hypothetical protein
MGSTRSLSLLKSLGLALLFVIGGATGVAALSTHVKAGPTQAPIDIIFDLDDTLIRWIRPHELPSGKVIPEVGTINDYRYRILDGAPEILQHIYELSKTRNIRISFYSMGQRARNLEVLKQLKLPNGMCAYDIAYKILSEEDAVDAHDTDGKEKQVSVVNSDLSQVIIVDDTAKSTVPEERLNVLRIKPKVEHFYLHAGETWVNDKGQVQRTAISEFLQNRNKLPFADGVLTRVLSQTEKSPLEALTDIQYEKDSEGNLQFRKNIYNDVSFYREGSRALHQVNPSYKFTAAFENSSIEFVRCMRKALTEPASTP